MPVVSLIVPVYTDFRANMKHLLQVQRVDYILYLPKLYFLGCANPLLLFAYSNFSYINKRGKCDEDLCYICKTEESWLEKKLFENGVLLTGDKNFLYIRMKKDGYNKDTRKTSLGFGIRFSNNTASSEADNVSSLRYAIFLLTI